MEKYPAEVVEFTVAPQVNPVEGLPYHEWLIEFGKEPEQMEQFAAELDRQLVKQNPYYEDLIEGRILRSLVIRSLRPNAFRQLMKSRGKLGDHNKTPHLVINRYYVVDLIVFAKE